MAVCEVCDNGYDKTFTVTLDGAGHTFASLECAIHALAPHCAHCDCRIIGNKTPAMVSGLATEPMTIRQLLQSALHA